MPFNQCNIKRRNFNFVSFKYNGHPRTAAQKQCSSNSYQVKLFDLFHSSYEHAYLNLACFVIILMCYSHQTWHQVPHFIEGLWQKPRFPVTTFQFVPSLLFQLKRFGVVWTTFETILWCIFETLVHIIL